MKLSRYILYLFISLICNYTTAYGQYFGSNPVTIKIVDNRGHTFASYKTSSSYNANRFYIKARKDAKYSIYVKNRTGKRLGLIIAVDGRNILSGAHSNLRATERMYVLNPYKQQKYKGWRTSSNRIHRFYFTRVGDSYADAWGDHSTMGIIAVAVFTEKYRPVQITREHNRSTNSRGQDAYKSSIPADAPGTGFGDAEYSPSRKVKFVPKNRPMAKYFFKYEWPRMLCRRGIIDCHRHREDFDTETPGPWRNESGFAPYPPSDRWWNDR